MWEAIAAKASTLSERIAAYRINGEGNSSPDGSVTQTWSRVAARSNDERFQRRLEFLDLSLDDLPTCLAEPDLTGMPLPDWCQFLADTAHANAAPPIDGAALDPAPEALADFVYPLVATALAELVQCRRELLRPEFALLRNDLTIQLLHELAKLVQTCVDVEHRRARLSLDDADSWSRWVGEQVAEGLVDFWVRYPALARLVGTSAQLWVARSAELLGRAAADIDAINERFDYQVTRLHRANLALSDSHNGHAGVADCTFVDDAGRPTHVIYKPKDITTEAIFADFCQWMNQHGTDLGQPLRVLPKRRYGWVEKATIQPASSAAELELFYRRCGSLAAMLFALGGVDFHAENVVAHGSTPIVIDAETVLHPILLPEGETADGAGARVLTDGPPNSVMDSYLLPRWIRMDDKAVDPSALGSSDTGIQPRNPRLEWQSAGSGAAHLVTRFHAGLQRNSDLVDEHGNPTRASDHADSLLEGFDHAWEILSQLRDGAFDESSPLHAFAASPIRAVIRRTSMYVNLLQASMAPVLLTDGLHRSMHLERLARYILNRRDSEQSLALVEAEREQLEIGDIPLFTVLGSQWELIGDDGARIVKFRESAIERATNRFTAMTAAELRRQHRYVRAALAVSQPDARRHALEVQAAQEPVSADLTGGERIANEEVRVAACRLLLEQVSEAADQSGKAVRIVGLTAVTHGQWGIDPLDSSFYDGSTGLATAVFAAARTLNDPEVEDLARSILAPAIADGVRRLDRLAQIRGLGAQNGIGGVLFGWAACRQLAATPASQTLIEEGLAELVSQLSPAILDQPQPYDLFSGRLGFLSGLLAAESVDVVVPASLMGRAIESTCLGLRESQRLTPRARRTVGFSHGEAGVAAILAEVWARDLWNRAILEELINECLVSESEKFDPEIDGWPQPRAGLTHPFLGGPGWCNGLPGIALSRAEIGRIVPGIGPTMIDGDLRLAAHGLMQSKLSADMLCCGNAGRAEVLRRLIEVLSDTDSVVGVEPRILKSAYASAIAQLSNRTVSNQLRLGVPRSSPLATFGLYPGIAGVLYSLAAAAPDEALPSLLSWRLGVSRRR